MNIIIENFISTVKSKSPHEWTKNQLEEFYFDLVTIYYYTPSKNKEEKEILKKMFDRIIGLLTNKGGVADPGKLIFIDRTSKF